MARIPHTREEFQRMDFFTKTKVKEKLLQTNFDAMCNAVNPQTLHKFFPVLHSCDYEELKLSRKIYSRISVTSDLLMRIMRCLKKKPTWWEILESVLLEEGSRELYYAMNPWETGDMNGGGAAGGGGGGDGRGGGGGRGGGSTPSAPMKPPCGEKAIQLCVRGPYNLDTPLTQTTGVHRVLAPLFPEGDDRLWRDLAEGLGLNLGDQLEIINKSQIRDLSHLLLEQFIKKYEDAATLGALVNALLRLGPDGQRVVREMEQRRIIHPLQRAGSEADGEVGGDMYDDEREGGTSARFAQAPTPRFPQDNTVAGQKFRAEANNLSFFQSPREESQRENTVFEGNSGLSVVRTETSSQESVEESILDNSRQSHKDNPSDKTGIVPEKIINRPPASAPAAQNLSEDGRNESQETAEESMPLQTDHLPSLSQADSAKKEISQLLQLSQQEIQDQLTAASQGPTTEVQQAVPSSPSQHNPTVHIINYINSVKNLVLDGKKTGSKDVRMTGDDEYEHEPPVPVSGDTSVGTGHSHIPARGAENHEGADCEENLSSYHPDPSDYSAHETLPKQVDTGCNEDEERLSGPEGEQDVSDIIDLRENSAGSLRDDNTLTVQSAFPMTAEGPQSGSMRGSADSLPVDALAAPIQEETDEVGNTHPADDDATSFLPPPHDLGNQQPLSPSPPQPQHHGLLSTAWTCIKDTLLGLE